MTTRTATALWTGLIVAAGVTLSFVLVCITPFAALATFAAKTLSRPLACVAVLGALVANQAVGFLCLGYPHTLVTYSWGVVMAAGAVAAVFAAALVRPPVLAFAAAFAVYEIVIFAYSVPTGTLAAFAPGPMLSVAEANLVGLAILGILRLAIVAGAGRLRAAHAHR